MAGKSKSDQFRDAAKKAKTVGDLKKQYAKEGAKRVASNVVKRLGPVGLAAGLAYDNKDKILKGMKDVAAKSNKGEADVSNFKNGGKVMMNKTMAYKKGGKVFKPCAGCPSPAKCKAAGKCLAKAMPKKKMKSGGMVKKKK
jgi:hypothetical protein